MEKFWMCWCPSGSSPARKHETKGLAEIEARRLIMNGFKEVHVLEMVSTWKPKPMEILVSRPGQMQDVVWRSEEGKYDPHSYMTGGPND